MHINKSWKIYKIYLAFDIICQRSDSVWSVIEIA